MNTASTMASLQWIAGPGVLIALLLTAAWIDWRTMRIPNWLTLAGMLWGLVWSIATANHWFEGLAHGASGLAVGLLLFLPFWLIRVMGAGDVKLMAMVGCFLGAYATFKAMLLVGVVGGLMVIAFAIAHRSGRQLAHNLRDLAYSAVLRGVPFGPPSSTSSIGKLPYGVSIGIGTVLFLLLRQAGWA